jgi:hypothetical protein
MPGAARAILEAASKENTVADRISLPLDSSFSPRARMAGNIQQLATASLLGKK